MTRLILLDRDGVINLDSPHYIRDVDEWVPIPGSLDAIAALKRAGFLVGVCSNQAGVARGILSVAALERIHRRFTMLLEERGVELDALRYCPHHPDEGCSCRKPRPGMLVSTMRALGVAPRDTLFVGDKVQDMEAAQAAGCGAVLVRSGSGTAAESYARRLGVQWVADDLADVARTLVREGPC